MIHHKEHVRAAHDSLAKSDAYFAQGDVLQGSRKLWDAVAHAMSAIAQQRNWNYENRDAIRQVGVRLSDEAGDDGIILGLSMSESFYANSIYDYMEADDFDAYRPLAKKFVMEMLALADAYANTSDAAFADAAPANANADAAPVNAANAD